MTTITVPRKTFLLGEYAALDGAGALIACTEPLFAFRTSPITEAAPETPVGKFMARHPDFFAEGKIQATEAFEGGWGASTAEYLAAYTLLFGEVRTPVDRQALLENYHQDAWNGQGRKPSGADLIAQSVGGLVYFEGQSGELETLDWPFTEHNAFLIKTDVKLATHEHLKTLPTVETAEMARLVGVAREALVQRDEEAFIECVQNYSRELQARKLTCESTLSLLHDLLWLEGVKAAKGCGALGADVVLVILEKSYAPQFKNYLHERALSFVEVPAQLSQAGAVVKPVESSYVTY